jgi:hypothetical protein|tara:strand:- start:282 stop:515 length:234 start_codon:yes stop_codon:yes gene_type:complete
MEDEAVAAALARLEQKVDALKESWDKHVRHHFEPVMGLDARLNNLLAKVGVWATIISLAIGCGGWMIFLYGVGVMSK